jgi:negative regulator of sigma E activity
MTTEALEFSISQYLDGTLPADEEAALVERLATDPAARALFAEYEKLNTVVKSAMPLPEIDWSSFSQQVSSAVEREDAPVKTFKLPMRWIGSVVAVAACAAIAFGVFFMNRTNEHGGGNTNVSLVPPQKSLGTITVTGPAIERTNQTAVAQVTITAPPSLAAGSDWHYAEDIVTRPSRVIIASSAEAAQDSSSLPY